MPEPAERPNYAIAPRRPVSGAGHRSGSARRERVRRTGDFAAGLSTPQSTVSSGANPDDPPPVWGNVPPRNPNFTAAKSCSSNWATFDSWWHDCRLPSTLHGMGGIGKTQIATSNIYRHLQDYDIIWWIEAARPNPDPCESH